MNASSFGSRAFPRLSAWLLLAGQLLYILITQLHAGGDANDHHSIFAEYAGNGIWTVVHVGQFASMVMLIGGLLMLHNALNDQVETAKLTGRLAAAAATATLTLYGALQAVVGVALKQAVNAWLDAPEAEKAARFATAETIRWLEWGLRSYQDFALGLALLLFGAAVAQVTRLPRAMAYLMILSGLTYFDQGWVAGSEGFSSTQLIAIVTGWALCLIWMAWLVVIAAKAEEPSVRRRSSGEASADFS